MASTLFFNGRVIATPGSYTEIDPSGLEQVGLGAAGIVAVLGTGEGGKPASAMTESKDFLRFTKPDAMRKTFRSGDLREAAMVFEPSSDPQILAGAQQVVAMKVNPAAQSSAVFSDSDGTALQITSLDYGAFTSQINVAIANGTVQGKLLTVVFESTTEASDNVGGGNMFTLQYTEPSGDGGWSVMTAQVLSSGVRANGTRARIGLATDLSSSTMSGDTNVQVVATAGDAGKLITVYGVNGTTPVRETLTLINGTVTGTQTFTSVYGSYLSAAAAGTITVQRATGPTTLHAYAASATQKGLRRPTQMYVAGSGLQLVADASSTAVIILWGRSPTGAVQSERIVLNGTTNVPTVGSWSQIDVIVSGDLAAARTLTINGDAGKTSNLVQNTLQKVVDYFNARGASGPVGFVATMVTGSTSKSPALLDLTSGAGQNVLNPATGSFKADLDAIINAITAGSALVSASRIAFAPLIYDITITPAAATFTPTINGTASPYTSGPGTAADIQAGLIASINNNATTNRLATAAAGSAATIVRVTASTPAGFTISVGAGLALTLIQSTAGVNAAPANTSQPVFLSGGSEGTAQFSDWQNALNLLKKTRVNSVVVLTGDPAVQAALDAHCAYMCGIGRSERDGFVGLSALDGSGVPTNTLPSKSSIESQIVDINSRHIRAFAQSIDKFNSAGERTTYLPWFQGLLAAGMQAGSPVGTSLTFKYANVLSIAQHSSWNPVDDSEEMIQAGLCFMENVEGVGRRFVRNVTTHLSTNNIAFTEGSVNAAVNFATFEFRTSLESAVGKRGFAGTINATKGVAVNELGLLQSAGVLVQWRALSLELVVDVLEVSVELAPIIPINFVKSTIHLVTVRQIAA